MEYQIAPAIIADNENELHSRIELIKNQVPRIHVDIMDGNFVQRKSNFFPLSLPKYKGSYEAHLMVKDPLTWGKRKECSHFDVIILHAELGHNIIEEAIAIFHKKKKE